MLMAIIYAPVNIRFTLALICSGMKMIDHILDKLIMKKSSDAIWVSCRLKSQATRLFV